MREYTNITWGGDVTLILRRAAQIVTNELVMSFFKLQYEVSYSAIQISISKDWQKLALLSAGSANQIWLMVQSI